MLRSILSFLGIVGEPAPVLDRVETVPTFSCLRLTLGGADDAGLPDPVVQELDMAIANILLPKAVFVAPESIVGRPAVDCEFYPEQRRFCEFHIMDLAPIDDVTIDYSNVSADDLNASEFRDAVSVLLAYPSVCRIAR